MHQNVMIDGMNGCRALKSNGLDFDEITHAEEERRHALEEHERQETESMGEPEPRFGERIRAEFRAREKAFPRRPQTS